MLNHRTKENFKFPFASPGLILPLVWLGLSLLPAPEAAASSFTFKAMAYKVIARHSAKALEVAGSLTTDGAPVDQMTFNAGTNQQWTFTVLSSGTNTGTYEILNTNSGKCLEVAADGVTVDQATYSGAARQQWVITRVSDHAEVYFNTIVNVNSGKCLQVDASSTADGAAITLATYVGTANQHWQFSSPAIHPAKVLVDAFSRDTCILHVAPDATHPTDMYYLTASTANRPDCWSDYDGLELWESPDLKTWKYLGFVWTFAQIAAQEPTAWELTWIVYSGGHGHLQVRVFARPEVCYFNNNFWIAYAKHGSAGCDFVKSNAMDTTGTRGDPRGPYVDRVVPNTASLTSSYDPNLFQDPDTSSVYFLHKGDIGLMNAGMTAFSGSQTALDVTNEAVSMIKHNGIYYLSSGNASTSGTDSDPTATYAAIDGQSSSVTGPFRPTYNAGNYTGSSTYFQDASGNWFVTIFGNGYVADQINGDNGAPWNCRPSYVPVKFDTASPYHIGVDFTRPAACTDLGPIATWELAAGKPSTADSEQFGHEAFRANDPLLSTSWMPADNSAGHAWTVDLGSTYDLTGSKISWPAVGAWQYKVETSADGTTWTLIVDKTVNQYYTLQVQNDPFTIAAQRYVKVTVTGAPAGVSVGINDFKIYGFNMSTPVLSAFDYQGSQTPSLVFGGTPPVPAPTLAYPDASGFTVGVQQPVWQYNGPTTFDGTSTYVDGGINQGVSRWMTVAFTMNASKLASMIPIDKLPAIGNSGWSVELNSSGSLLFRVGSNDTTNTSFQQTTVTSAYAANTPVNVVCTMDRGTSLGNPNGIETVYINGVSKGTTTGILYLPYNTTTPLRLGIPSSTRTTEIYSGTLQNVRLWNRVLTSTEIANVTVTTPPTLTPPADITVPMTATWTPVDVGQATATPSGGISGVTITNNSPAYFPLGTTVVTWTATDTNGNVSTATQNITIQNDQPPLAPVITAISPDTGSSSTDQITNATALVLSGTSQTQVTSVTVTQAGVGVIGTTTTVDSSGNWSFDYTGTILSDGIYTFTAVATNANGNGPASSAFTATVDTAAPAAPSITDLSGYPLVISGASEAGSKVVVSQVGTGVIGTTTANGSGSWSFTYTGSLNLGTGSYTFTATQTDVAGNTGSASAGSATTVTDTTPPAAPVFTSITTDTGSSSTDRITNDPTLLLNGTAEAGSTVTVTQTGAGVIGSTAADGSGNWSFNYTGTILADGTYSFTATATDAALNTGAASAAFVVTIDTSSPTVISSNRQSPATTIVAPGSNVTYQVIFSEAVSGVTTAAFTLTGSGADSGTIATVTAVSATTYNVTVNNVQGAFYDTLRLDVNGTGVTDLAGNAAGGFTGGQTYTLLFTGNGTWINTASGGLWGGPSNWSGNVVASGTGNTANFSTLDLTADNTVHLDSAQTINRLVFADTATATGANWILDNNGSAANTLTLAGTTPGITVNAMGTGNTTAISAVVAGTAGLAKLGVGTLVLSGANTISGAVTIGNTTATGTAVSGGIIRLDTGASLTATTLTIGPIGTLGGTNAGVLVNGGTLVVTGATALDGGGGVIAAVPARNIIEVDSGTATFTGAFATTLETSTLKITGGTVTFSSTLNFFKSATNTTSDPTAHSIDFTGTAGGIIITGGNTTATGAVGIGRNAAGAAMIVSGGTTTLNSTLRLANGISTVNRGGGLRVTGGTLTVADTAAGLVLITKGTSILNNFAVAEFAGGVSTVGRISIAGDTSQTTGIGQVYVDGGTLYIGAGGIATPAGTSAAPGTYLYSVKLGGSGFLPGLTVAGASNVAMLGGTQFTGDGILGAAANWSSAVNMVLGGNTTLQAADAGGTPHHITLSGVLSGAGGLVKTGGGTLTLSGNNTYTGTLVVNAGTLEKSGAGASAIILNNGGAVAPGTNGTVGTLGASSLTWNGGGQALFDLGASSDLLALTGALTKGNAGTYGFVFTGGTSLANNTTITLATFGSTNFTAQDLSATGGPAGSFAVNAANLQFVVSAIGTIAGTVTDASSVAISGASVSVVVSGTTYSATSGSDGTYAIGSVPAGTGYTVTASATGYLNGTATNVAVTAGGTTPGINFALSPSVTTGTITGTVTNSASAVISGASVSVVVGGTTYSATSTVNGTYEIDSVPAGTGYTVTASAAGYASGTATSVPVTAGQTTANVNITLTVSFASWAATHFTLAELADPSISGPAADPDHDGIPNLLEYAFNLNPKAADRSGLPVLGTTTVSGSQYLTLSYTQQTLTGDLTYAIQSSPDMAAWSAVTPVVVSTVDNGNGTQTVVVRDPVALDSGTRRFLRVVVSGL